MENDQCVQELFLLAAFPKQQIMGGVDEGGRLVCAMDLLL